MTSRSDVADVLTSFIDRVPADYKAGAAVLVNENGLSASIEVAGDPTLAWYHFTKLMLGLGHHPSDLMWSVVVASGDRGADERDNDARSE